MGIICMATMLMASLMLMENIPNVKDLTRLSSEIQTIFGLESVSIAQVQSVRGLRYRIICRSHRDVDRKQLQAIGSYAWQNCPPARTPAEVVVVYRQRVAAGCAGQEHVYEENIAPPAPKAPVRKK